MFRFRYSLPILFLVILTACLNKPVDTQNPTPVNSLAAKITLTPTKGALVGQVTSTTTSEPLANTVVRLAKVFWDKEKKEGAYVLEGATSPSAITDENGMFAFSNIDPADYVIVVGDVIGYHQIISNPDGTAKIYTVKSDQTLEIEKLGVNLNQ